jgi:hypothetical protein
VKYEEIPDGQFTITRKCALSSKPPTLHDNRQPEVDRTGADELRFEDLSLRPQFGRISRQSWFDARIATFWDLDLLRSDKKSQIQSIQPSVKLPENGGALPSVFI